MNILMFHSNSDLYGASRILLFTIETFQNEGHYCKVILSSEGPLSNELEQLKVDYEIINLGILRRKYLNFKGIINRIKVTRKAWKALNKLIEKQKPDLIYTNTSGILISAFIAKKHNIKHIWHLHEIILRPKIFTIAIGKLINSYSDKVVVVSEAVKRHWKKYIEVSKITRIYNGIKTTKKLLKESDLRSELNILPQEIVITMIGRINQWKGQDYFLDIAEVLLSENKNLKFVMVGDPFPGNEYMANNLEERISKMKFKDNIINLYYRTDINRILEITDIFICPSILPDPFPTVILEAMSAEKAIVATMQGGALEMIVENETGLLIPINKPQEAAKIIYKLIDVPSLRSGFAKAGKARLEQNFSYDAFQKNILQLINS
ncbi:MAG: glycosyltransferase family 4 protein [Bacteroidetes bacterium]|nr:glycosyltransferase family 4 protein [Bacteroidota bacterium]MBU1484482.1 glycosyltransferase family 4 protein [Bacteroidota bacterium]MBU2046926.1 glycosyltransferase family 4 protein [Bacteroidota bacterium]MBU2267457.1 glycosyltransferase family 4 protein [Bacteroidota bacterium]MBU2375216.1 glycosyltransferase family 4 protein [Bacteroidota bacterium]